MSEIHDNIQQLIPAYALGAVPEEEMPAIRAHILSCEECFEEAESYSVAMAAMSEGVDPVTPSAGFEDRVLRAALGDDIPEKATKAPRSRWWAPTRSSLLVGVAALLAVLLALSGAALLGSNARQREYQQAIASLVDDRDSFALEGPGGAEAVLASTKEGSVLVALDLGDAPDGRVYQLWLMRDGRPIPADTFDASGSVVIYESDERIEKFDGAAVTVEPEGGSEQPTTDPVLSS